MLVLTPVLAVVTPLGITKVPSDIFTVLVNVAAVPVIILSVDATPTSPEPSPTNFVAVATPVMTTPLLFACALTAPPNLIAVASIPVKFHHYHEMQLR